jgi:hypothetical protein
LGEFGHLRKQDLKEGGSGTTRLLAGGELMYRITFAITIILLVISFGTFTSRAQEDGWLIDIPCSPVQLKHYRRAQISVTNRSEHEIAEIFVGVVWPKDEGFIVDSRRTKIKHKGSLPGSTNLIRTTFAIGSHAVIEDIDYAIESKGKLAVVYVEFTDGTSWSLEDECNQDLRASKSRS